MAHSGGSSVRSFSIKLLASYALDWIVLIIVVVASGFLGRIAPQKRPFSLEDPNIQFQFAVKETVPTTLLVVLCCLMPTIVILIVSLLLVPGNTVPKTTSNALIWKRKLWELHVGWLGLLMAVGASFFFISGMKNICGKPRPDMLSRCMPDVANAAKYVIGGYGGKATATTLYSADICKQTDEKLLNDGFRSFPSGHSSSSAAGLIYLSLFLASKFSVTMPFVVSFSAALDDSLHTAFPSRALPRSDPYESARLSNGAGDKARIVNRNALHNTRLQSLRRQAAAPPVYLLVITLVPFCLAIFIACSRWFNYRHHGFDILFGFLIGTITAIYSFRYYHLPITSGAGWAWASRSNDRAFWAGVGRLGFAGDNLDDDYPRPLDPADLGESGDVDIHGTHGGVSSEAGATHRGDRPNAPGAFSFQDVELGRMDQRGQQAAPYGQVP